MALKLFVGAAAVLALAVLGKAKPRKQRRDAEREHRLRRKEAEGTSHNDGHHRESASGMLPNADPAAPAAQSYPEKASRSSEVLGTVLRIELRLLLSIVLVAALQALAGWPAPLVSLVLGAALVFLLSELISMGFRSPPRALEEAAAQVQLQRLPLPADEAKERLQDFNGLWVKDKEGSDSMEEACQLMRMNALLRTAVRLIKGLQIRQSEEEFEMSVLSGILWFKVTERYPLSGEERSFKRRDLRSGTHTSSLHPQQDGSLQMRLAWPEPFGGTGTDTFYSPSPGTLWVTSSITVGGRTVRYRQVYHKA